MNHNSIGIDVHERELRIAVLKKRENFSLRIEYQRVNWRSLSHQSKEGKKNVAVESVGFIHTIYERLSSIDRCKVYVASPNKLNLISQSSTKNDARILDYLLRMN